MGTVPQDFPLPSLNQLLAGLPPRELSRMMSHLEIVDLKPKQILHETNDEVRQVYFPIGSVVVRIVAADDGASVEVGMIGREGMTGVCTYLGNSESPYRETVLFPGSALRGEASFILQEIKRDAAFAAALRNYVYSSYRMMAHSAACNQLHRIQQRCCRLLLMMHDRAGADEFKITHETLSLMLGVRRASVSQVAGYLRNSNFVRYRWGHVKVLNRRAIETEACPCYQQILATNNHRAADIG